MNETGQLSDAISFKKQIPVTDITAWEFKSSIQDTQILCAINGVRVNDPFRKGVNIDVSFKILNDLNIITSGTSITGKELQRIDINPYFDEKNINGNNVTLNFDANIYSKGMIEVNNTHELYSIFAIALKSKGLMSNAETGSIIVEHNKINDCLIDTKLYLTTVKVLSDKNNLEVIAKAGETQ